MRSLKFNLTLALSFVAGLSSLISPHDEARLRCGSNHIVDATFSVNKTENENHFDFGDLELKAGELLRVCGGKSPV